MTKLFLLPGGLGRERRKGTTLTKRTIIAALALAAVAAPSIALAGPMNLADPVVVPIQASTTWHDSATTWQSGRFQKPPRLQRMLHAGRH